MVNHIQYLLTSNSTVPAVELMPYTW